MSSCMPLCTLCYAKYDSTGEGGAGINAEGNGLQKLEAQFTGLHNHTSHINKVWDPFCKRKWFGISKWEWKHL